MNDSPNNNEEILELMEFAESVNGKDSSELQSIKENIEQSMEDRSSELDKLQSSKDAAGTTLTVGSALATIAMSSVATGAMETNIIAAIATPIAGALGAVLTTVGAIKQNKLSKQEDSLEQEQNQDQRKIELLDKALDGAEINLSDVKEIVNSSNQSSPPSGEKATSAQQR